MAILVIAEHDHGQLNPVTLSTLKAATQLGGDVEVLVAGHDCQNVVEQLTKCEDVQTVLSVDNLLYQHFLPENLSLLIVSLAQGYSHILAPATTFGKNFMPRLSALLDVQMVSDITAIESEDTFKRPIYAGNAVATVQCSSPQKLLTIRPTAFEKVALNRSAPAPVRSVPAAEGFVDSAFVSVQQANADKPQLSQAKVVVSGGRGLQKAENFKMLEDLATKLGGGAIGASRAAVDVGWIGNDCQVGQTGKVVAPELYVAVGISGAIQHIAGMKDSKVIVAINKDENAPIFEVATYGLVADLFDAVPELIEKLAEEG